MAITASAGPQGPEVRNDCRVELRLDSRSVEVESTVGAIYGRKIEATVRETLDELGLTDAGARVIDTGAFDFCLRARVEAAALSVRPDARPIKLSTPPRVVSAEHKRRRRTRLYLPGNTPKYFINACLHGADAVILDLEDAVPSPDKHDARHLVRHALASIDFGSCETMVRINCGEERVKDLQTIEGAGAETLLLPKTESAEEVEALPAGYGVVPLLESARGIANAEDIARATGVVALAIGVEDYLADIEAVRSTEALAFAYGAVINAARAAGVPALASVWGNLDDPEGFQREVARLIGLGFEGVGCLHPMQVPLAQRAMEPSASEIESARRIVDAFEAAGGAIAVDGHMVDAPVAERARRVLERAGSGRASWRVA